MNIDDIRGESFGDINEIFFKKGGKSIIEQNKEEQTPEKINVSDIVDNINKIASSQITGNKNGSGNTVIHISKDVIDGENDLIVSLTDLEEKRKNTSSVRNKHFIDMNTGEEVKILEQTEMYNGMNLFMVKNLATTKIVTYPRSMFVGYKKRFVPREFYIREAERSIEDTIERFSPEIIKLVNDSQQLSETMDGKFLEIVLEPPLSIMGGILVPDNIQIPVKRLFDLEYKLLLLESVICQNNKIAALLFIDIWF